MRTARDRFITAFHEELAEHPDVPPGPKALGTRMGWPGSERNLNGWQCRLRTEMLTEAGFVKDEDRNRWVKPLLDIRETTLHVPDVLHHG